MSRLTATACCVQLSLVSGISARSRISENALESETTRRRHIESCQCSLAGSCDTDFLSSREGKPFGPVFRLLSSIHGHVTHNIWSLGPLHLSNVTATLPSAEKKDDRSQVRPDLQSSRPTRCACFDRRKSPIVLTLPCFLELLCTASSFEPEDSFRSISEGFFESLFRGTGSGLPSENSIREAWSSPFRLSGPVALVYFR